MCSTIAFDAISPSSSLGVSSIIIIEDIRLDEEPVLKTGNSVKTIVGSNPSSSAKKINAQSAKKIFIIKKLYLHL